MTRPSSVIALRAIAERAAHPEGRPAPLGDGAQLRVTRNGHLIGYCLSPDDLPALGVDMSRIAVVARW